MGRVRIAKALIRDLKEKRETSKKRKNELEKYLRRLKESYATGKISYARYVEILHKKNDERNISEWIEYYDRYEKECGRERKKHQKKVIINKTLTTLFSIALISVLIYFFFFSNFVNLSFTGLAIGERRQLQEFSQDLNLILTDSTNYEWQLENIGKLTSVKLTGLIEGGGEVKIYLDDLLILDSTDIEKPSAESNTTESSSPGIFASFLGFFSNARVTGGTVEEGTTSEISETPTTEQTTETPTATQKETTETSSEEANQDNPPIEEIKETSTTDTQNEIIDPTDEQTSKTPDSNSEEQKIQANSNKSSEEINKNGALQNETSNPSQEEPQTSETNATEISTQNETQSAQNETEVEEIKIQNETETIIKIFTEICKDTCNLKNLDLNKSSYTLRIEISNAKLQLDTITYEILLEEIPEEETNISVTNITTQQYSAVLGQPVKWKKQISLDEPGSAKIELPKEAENIVVNKILENKYSEEQEINKNGALQNETSNPSQEEPQPSEKGEIKEKANAIIETKTRQENKESGSPSFGITGNIVSTSKGTSVNEEEIIEVLIEGNATQYEIEYETPAPYAVEENLTNGKRVKIVGPETIHYENVLAFTDLPETLNIKNPSSIKIHWIENNTFIPVQNIQDTDNNGIYDYIEWIAPHLSNQTFEIIVITKAEHLDSNRNFISDIYEQVKALDDIWSETINPDEYVRVTFEVPLDNTRDITIYPRTISGTPSIEVYEKDENTLIAEFTNINSNQYN
ncbi:MAG: hypothetical protein ABIE36_00700, partial [Candidatus Diapherotrites archaeon]